MIVFILAVYVCWSPWNCEWRTVGAFVSEEECADVGKDYARDDAVSRFRCVVNVRGTR
jgi:hypothetical protein